jgi:hypothetical protein
MMKSDSGMNSGKKMGLSPDLLKILACPKCKQSIRYNEETDTLDCEQCRLRYRIDEGIPVMLEEEARPF